MFPYAHNTFFCLFPYMSADLSLVTYFHIQSGPIWKLNILKLASKSVFFSQRAHHYYKIHIFYDFLLIHLSIYLFYTTKPEEQLFIEGGWIELSHGVQDVHMYSKDVPCSTGWSQGLEERGGGCRPRAKSHLHPHHHVWISKVSENYIFQLGLVECDASICA